MIGWGSHSLAQGLAPKNFSEVSASVIQEHYHRALLSDHRILWVTLGHCLIRQQSWSTDRRRLGQELI
jgi:hypothetical protein